MRISVIGAGYVGLTTGACFARLGNEVILIDIDRQKVKAIKGTTSPVYEEGLSKLLSQVDIKVSSDYQQATNSEAIFICVGTPPNEDGSVSLGQITEATREISKLLKRKRDYCVVTVKSTVPPGTTEELVIPILAQSGKKVGRDFGVCMSPEFLREGKVIYDFMNPARVIIGEYDKGSGDMLLNLYHSFNAPILRTDLKTAEMIKLASNAFLATKVSFINEVGNICKQLGIDVYEVAKGMGFDDRIGSKFLNAGIGFGGSCLPKDLQALVFASSNRWGYPAHLLQSVLDVNKTQAVKIVEMAERKIGSLHNKKVTVLGLAFKPNTDDIRNAPAIRVIEMLLERGAFVRTYDPKAMSNAKRILLQDVKFCSNASEAINDSDCVLILTEWDEFGELSLYTGRTVIDGRRALDPQKARVVCDYEGICW